MAAIKQSDILTRGAINAPKKLAESFEQLEKRAKALIETGKKLDRSFDAADNVKKLNTETKKLTTSEKELLKVTREMERIQSRLTPEYQEQQKALFQLRAEQQKVNKQMRETAQRSVGLRSGFQRLGSTIKGALTSFVGIAAAVTAFVGVVRNAVKIIADYEKANSVLRATLDKTRKETEGLRKQQQLLGATTAFTATQVAEAQTELGRLGLTIEEITALTPSVLDLAVAFGVDLADAGELVAGQLNAFGLAASEGARVSDVLAKATQISAFNFERLKTSLAIVSPAARAVGATIEQTTAILSAAVDANIDASTAATGLRNIFIDLSENGLTWEQALDQINNSQNKLNTAFDLFGKRGAVVASVIADNTDKISQNTRALNEADGAARRFADETLDNLRGDVTLLNSAWQGFILSLEEGDGAFARASRSIVQFATNAINGLTTVSTQFRLLFNDVEDLENKDLDNILAVGTTNEGNLITDVIQEAIESLRQFPEAAGDVEFARLQITRALIAQGESFETARTLANRYLETVDLRGENLDQPIDLVTESLEKQTKATKVLTDELGKLSKRYNNDVLPSVLRAQRILDRAALDTGLTENAQEFAEQGRAQLDALIGDIETYKTRSDEATTETTQNFFEKNREAIQLTSDLFRGFADLRIQQLAQQSATLDAQRNAELQAAGENAEARDRINVEFDRKQAAIRRRQLEAEKQASIFNIAITTAESVARYTGGLPFTAPLLALAIATGVAQTALVLSQQVPQFAKGTDGPLKADTPAWVGEQGTEGHLRNGKLSLTPSKPTLTYLKAGDEIIPNDELNEVLAAGVYNSISPTYKGADSSGLSMLQNELRGVRSDLRKYQPKFYGTGLDSARMERNGSWTTYLNSMFRK